MATVPSSIALTTIATSSQILSADHRNNYSAIQTATNGVIDYLNAGSGATSSAPPGSPVDGSLWYFPADAANGIVWMFRYNASSVSAYKWEFVGGAPLRAVVVTQESTTNPGATTLATLGPSLTVPRSGDYNVEMGAVMYNITAGTAAKMWLYFNAVGTGYNVHSGAQTYTNVWRSFTLPGLTVGQPLDVLYSQIAGGTANFGDRTLTLIPKRVS